MVGLRGLVDEEPRVATRETGRCGTPQGHALGDLGVVHEQVEPTTIDVECDPITGLHDRERAAHGRLRGDVEHAGAVARAAHPGVRHAHHVPHAPLEQRPRNRQHAPLGHARCPERAGISQHEHVVGRDARGRVVDPGLEVGVRIEDDGAADVRPQPRLGGGRLDHASVRRERAPQHERAAGRGERRGQRQDHAVVDHLGPGDALAERPPGDGEASQVEQVGDAREECRHTAGIVEVLHEVLPGGPEVGEHGRRARERVEAVERQGHARTAGEREQVDDGVRRAGERHVGDDRVVERRRGQDPRGTQVLPHHVDDPAAARRSHPGVGRVDGGDRRRARQGHPQRLGDGRHRRCRAHRHARAGGPRDALLELPPDARVETARLALRPILPHVRAAAEPLGPVATGEHGARGQEDRGQVGRDRAHEEPRDRLVAAPHEHGAVHRMAPQHLLGLEREQVAVEHRRRLHEHLGECEHRDLHRKPARLPDAALHLLHPLREVRVALRQVAPGVEDGDDGPPLGLLGRVAHLPQAAAMAEAAEIVRGEPALRAQTARIACAGKGGAGGRRCGHGTRRRENAHRAMSFVSRALVRT